MRAVRINNTLPERLLWPLCLSINGSMIYPPDPWMIDRYPFSSGSALPRRQGQGSAHSGTNYPHSYVSYVRDEHGNIITLFIYCTYHTAASMHDVQI
jgi:hypothetical protein